MGNISTLAVNEIFGPTFQGEGANLGKPCVFLRLAACNLACVWCDTPYAWDWSKYDIKKESHKMTIDEVYETLQAYKVRHLVISGGEPMLQQKALFELTKRLHDSGWYTEIETAGTIAPITTELVTHFNISPKLENSGNGKKKRYNKIALETLNYAPSKAFKFVVSSIEDFDEIDQIVNDTKINPVYIMPEGITQDDIERHSKQVAGATIERGYSLTTRLHVTIYGNQRSV